jgi:RNA 3'-terminal phosphate cyclase (ATP)
MITIDGSQGEGGGQILRSALALSMTTGQPFRIFNIRAGRPKPGLMRQHLTCVQAAEAVCGGRATGAAVGAQELEFHPGAPRPGEYHFAIGSAGGTMLVLQAVLPALLRAGGGSRIVIEGGTHNKAAPPFEFFSRCLAPLLERTGAGIAARLERHGFYPVGGGRIVVEVQPASVPRPLVLTERGERLGIKATAIVSKISREVGEREVRVLSSRLSLSDGEAEIRTVNDAPGAGNVVLVELRYEHVTEVCSSIGELGRAAESVARGAADEARAYITSRRPVGLYLADQLMTPLAVLAGGRYAASRLTDHARTNMEVLGLFGVKVRAGQDGCVEVEPVE